jgi:hypothetical protein
MIGAETMLVQRVATRRTVIRLLLTATLCLSSALPASAAPAAPVAGETAAPAPAIDEEAARLGQALRQEVPHLIVDKPDSARAWIEYAQAAIAPGGYKIDRPQLLVVVDRNPRVQQMRIVLARPDAPWQSLGGSKVSTGRPRGFEHFLTPTGVFSHTDRILDWRAEGTFNENHVRGLGMEGMRVWDFGWQRAVKGWGPPGGVGTMRLLLHATDPATLERRIGSAASDGCVRIPTAMNRFLDLHGVLDSDYEQTAKRNARFAAAPRPDADGPRRQRAGDHRFLGRSGVAGFDHASGSGAEPGVRAGAASPGGWGEREEQGEKPRPAPSPASVRRIQASPPGIARGTVRAGLKPKAPPRRSDRTWPDRHAIASLRAQ